MPRPGLRSMNHLPRAVSRRASPARAAFLPRLRRGLGKIALASLLVEGQCRAAGGIARRLDRPGQSADAQAAALRRPRPSASSTCSWPARPASSTCSTTSRELAQVRRQAAAGRGGQGTSGTPSSAPTPALLRPAVQVRQARPVRRRALRDAAAPGQGRRRHRHRQVGAHRPVQPRPGADLPEHRLAAARPARAWARGSPTAWAANRTTCPASSCSPSGRGISGGAANWSSGFLPTVYQGVPFRTKGDPILERHQPRRHRPPSSSATRST